MFFEINRDYRILKINILIILSLFIFGITDQIFAFWTLFCWMVFVYMFVVAENRKAEIKDDALYMNPKDIVFLICLFAISNGLVLSILFSGVIPFAIIAVACEFYKHKIYGNMIFKDNNFKEGVDAGNNEVDRINNLIGNDDEYNK